jgi:hypothetical protein
MEQRNDIELQAIAALSHVGDIVLFLIDATETSESSLESQLSLKSEIEMLLDDTPMITVIGKADLLGLDDWQAAFDASKAIQLATQAEVEPSEPESRVESEAEEAESIEPVSEVEAGPEEVEAEGVEDEKHRHKSNKEEEIEEPILIYKPLDSRAISPLTGTGLEPLRSEMIRMIAEKNVIPRLELPEDWPVRRITADRPPIEDY